MAGLAILFKITDFKLNPSWSTFIKLIKKQVPISFSVAISEEFIFRFIPLLIFGCSLKVLLITSFLFSLLHFTHGMYQDVKNIWEIIRLGIGLFILGIVLFKLAMINPMYSILYHAGLITGVEITTFFLHPESAENNLWWDESARLIRTPFAWIIMPLILLLF